MATTFQWLPKLAWLNRFWQQKWSRGPVLAKFSVKIILAKQILGDQFLCDKPNLVRTHQTCAKNGPDPKAKLRNNYFASVFTHEDLLHIPKISVNQEPDIPDVDIQIEGVTKLL